MADKNDDREDQTPEEVTMKDLWQHISGLKGEIRGVRSELKAEIQGVETRLKAEIQEARTEMNTRFDDQDDQLEAIRKVVDTDMARHPDLVRVENKVSDVAVDVRDLKGRVSEVKGQVSKVQSRLDRGGIPV